MQLTPASMECSQEKIPTSGNTLQSSRDCSSPEQWRFSRKMGPVEAGNADPVKGTAASEREEN